MLRSAPYLPGLLGLLMASAPAFAAKPLVDISAGAAATACRHQGCADQMDGFLAGYRTGLQKGIRSTYSHDPLVLQTTTGHEETYLRYRRVAQLSLCLPATLTGVAAQQVFLEYLQGNPHTEAEPFGDVMEVALDTAFACTTPKN